MLKLDLSMLNSSCIPQAFCKNCLTREKLTNRVSAASATPLATFYVVIWFRKSCELFVEQSHKL